MGGGLMKYDKKIVARICQLISTDSYTIGEICRIVGISKDAFYDWKAKKSDFSDAIKKAENDFNELVIAEAKKSLMKKVRGYTEQERKTVTVNTGKLDDEGKPVVRVREHTVTDKYFQPDTAAIIFALTNRDPENWKNRQNTDLTTGGEKIEFKGFNFLPYTPDEEGA
jgi:transposase-like protein